MTSATDAGLTRRERLRRATFDEIVEVSRTLVASDEQLSLRAVATEMGMTAPALYRYVDSYADLVRLVAHAIFNDVSATITQGAARHPDDDPGAQIVTACVSFRSWALAHRREYALLFANPAFDKHGATADDGEGAQSSGAAFGQAFAGLYARLWRHYRFPLPDTSDLDTAVLEQCSSELGSELSSSDPDLDAALGWSFTQAWVRLYGTVTMEVFNVLGPELTASEALFLGLLTDLARNLAFGDDWPRLRQVVRDELARATA